MNRRHFPFKPLFLCLILALPSYGQINRQSKLEAAFVYQFAAHTRWAFGEPVSIAIFENQKVYEEIIAFAPDHIGRHRLKVVRAEHPGDLPPTTKLVYFGSETPHEIIRATCENLPDGILTIAGEGTTTSQDLMIELVEYHNRLRFRINHTLAKEKGINLSSKLLELAIDLR